MSSVRLFCAVPLLVSFLFGVQKTQQVPYCSGPQALSLEHVPLGTKTLPPYLPQPSCLPPGPWAHHYFSPPRILFTMSGWSLWGFKGTSTSPQRGGLKHLCRRLLIFKILLNVDY